MAFKLFQTKQKETRDLDSDFDRVYAKIQEMDDWDDPKKIEHYILDSCEQIVSTTKEIELERKELRSVSNYARDLDVLENLSEDSIKEIRQTARRLVTLKETRLEMKNHPHKVEGQLFEILEENREDLEDTIFRMRENENYQDSVKRDMNYLEGEKTRYEMDRENSKASMKVMRTLSLFLVVGLGALLALVFVLKFTTDMDVNWIVMGILLLISGFAVLIYVKNAESRRRSKRALKKLNNTIQLLNIVRMKYATVTKALEYVRNQYGIESAEELDYLYHQYLLEVEDQERYRQTNQDLDHQTNLLEKQLGELNLYDQYIWKSQAEALANPDGLKETRLRLVERKERIEDQIRDNTGAVKKERDEIDRMMNEHRYYVPEILEIIQSVDKICGLNRYMNRTTGTNKDK